MMSGLKTFSSKLPDAPPMLTATSLPITCAQSMVMASDWVGFTLPGMIELPGSFSGMVISPMPQRGPGGQPAHVVGDLVERRGQRLERAVRVDERVVGGQRLELVGRGHERDGRSARRACRATRTAYSGWALSPVPTAVPPRASSHRWGSAASRWRDAVVELRDVAGELLAQRERRGVLQVGAADLDDVARRPRAFAASASRSARTAGQHVRAQRRPPRPRSSRWGRRRCEDWPLLTSSLGWTSRSSPRSPPRISLARLASTSFMFMLVWVPLPVCQTTSGNSSSCRPASTSSAGGHDGRAPSCASSAPEVDVHERGRLLDQGQRVDERARHALARRS